jgi:hypothetical protein
VFKVEGNGLGKATLTKLPALDHNHELVGAPVRNRVPVSELDSDQPRPAIIEKEDISLRQDIKDAIEDLSRTKNLTGEALRTTIKSLYFKDLGGAAGAHFSSEASTYIKNQSGRFKAALFNRTHDANIFSQSLAENSAKGGFSLVETTDDGSFKRAFWATPAQVQMAVYCGGTVVQVSTPREL